MKVFHQAIFYPTHGDLNNKVMENVTDQELEDKHCNCNVTSKLKDGRCMYDEQCRMTLIVYALEDKTRPGHEYIGKIQRYFKTRTAEHFFDVWKDVDSGRKKLGEENWRGSRGYGKADAFAKNFAKHCCYCKNSNEVRAKLKEIVNPRIIWKGDQIQCMKSVRTMQCKI